MFTTGDKLLNVMKEEEISIAELAKISGVPEHTILEILAGIREPELNVMCKIIEGLGICVHEFCGDEEKYAVAVQKNTLVKLIVVSEMNGVELEELVHRILEKGIENLFLVNDINKCFVLSCKVHKVPCSDWIYDAGLW